MTKYAHIFVYKYPGEQHEYWATGPKKWHFKKYRGDTLYGVFGYLFSESSAASMEPKRLLDLLGVEKWSYVSETVIFDFCAKLVNRNSDMTPLDAFAKIAHGMWPLLKIEQGWLECLSKAKENLYHDSFD